MSESYQMIYRDSVMTVETEFNGQYPITLHHVYHDFSDWDIRSITVCEDKAINDLVYDLILDNPLEKPAFITALIHRAQEVYEESRDDLRLMAGGM